MRLSVLWLVPILVGSLVLNRTYAEAGGEMLIRLVLPTTELTAVLDDNATSRSFFEQLPLDVTLEDYHSTEKIFDPPKPLSTEGAPSGYDPAEGDITYFAPWGNLAIFYRDFRYSRGLIRMGQLSGDISALNGGGPIRARLEAIVD